MIDNEALQRYTDRPQQEPTNANVIPFNRSVARRYAKLMTTDFASDKRQEAIEEYLSFATQLADAGAITHARIDEMVERKRERLIHQLQELKGV